MPPMSKNFLFILILVYLIVGIRSFSSILSHNFKVDTKNKELENKILNTQLQLKQQELNYLKQQIHPHFLFNTLNTIYGFAIRQSKQTPDIILKLSNLLDYILYQINKPQVSLREEVLHIQEYIELEKIRFQDNLKVETSINEIDKTIQIAPMLLIPFVENAFKHGEIVNGYLQINVQCKVENNQLHFVISNSVKEHEETINNHGIGLENIGKRLDLHYKDSYQLKSQIKDNTYIVELIINKLNNFKNV